MNAAYFAGAPNAAGVDKLEKVWRGLRRHDVFPVTFRSVLGFMGGADNLIDPSNLRKLIERNIPFPDLEDAPIPVHVVATNLGGATVCLSSGPTVEALLASAAIPAAFPSVHIGEHHLIDGAVGSNTPILNAADLGATRIIAGSYGSRGVIAAEHIDLRVTTRPRSLFLFRVRQINRLPRMLPPQQTKSVECRRACSSILAARLMPSRRGDFRGNAPTDKKW